MLKKISLALLCVSLLAPLVAADVKLEITSPQDGKVFETDGSMKISVTVKNLDSSSENASSVKITGSGGGLKFSSGSMDIPVGKSNSLTLTVKGIVWEETAVELKTDSGGEVTEDSVDIYVKPAKMELDIIGPRGKMSLVDVEEGSSTSFDVTVKNTGRVDLEGVGLTVTDNRPGVECSVKTGTKDMASLTSASFTVKCDNITSGVRLELTAKDKNNGSMDSESLVINLVEGVKRMGLGILSPVENEELRFGVLGGVIDVVVNNTGEATLKGVCAYMEGIGYGPDECVDMNAGETHTFSLGVTPTQNLTNAYIVVNDSEAKADDRRGVRILRVEPQLPGVNETASDEKTDVLGGEGNATPDVGGETGGESISSSLIPSRIFGIQTEYIVVLFIILIFVGIGAVVREKNPELG